MATPTDSTGATFRAHHAAGVDPVLAHEASEELRNQAAINVITQFAVRFDKIDAQFITFKNQHWVLLTIITTGVIGGLIALLFR